MEKEFVPYELALRMKALGFDEPCIIEMSPGNFDIPIDEYRIRGIRQDDIIYKLDMIKPIINSEIDGCTRPTFSQAFRWFREEHDIDHDILRVPLRIIELQKKNGANQFKKYTWSVTDQTANPISVGDYSDDYEECELACLEKLIEIVESK